MIFDTNTIIFISKNIVKITDLIPPNATAKMSIISYIEAMGFSFENEKDQFYTQRVCASCQIVPLSDLIAEETISLRKKYRIKLPDAIIYATAVVENLPLITNNIADFKNLGNRVELINPLNL